VVEVLMGDEDVIDSVELQSGTDELAGRALPTVDKVCHTIH
jgi:hypothetical protein